jgi:hypothetical protein
MNTDFNRRTQRERSGKEGEIMSGKITGRITNLRFEISKQIISTRFERFPLLIYPCASVLIRGFDLSVTSEN